MNKNPVAKELRTPKYKSKKVESKKKYNRKRKISGYYFDGKKLETLYDDRDCRSLYRWLI